MKKKFFVVIAIIAVLVILLTPVRMNLKDGGSVRYKALVYHYACLSFCCAADCGACGRKLNAKGTPDGFLSHLQSFSLTKARLKLILNK